MNCPNCLKPVNDTDKFCSDCGNPLSIDRATNTPVTAPDPFLNRKLDGRYEISRYIGQGGMGRVYLAERPAFKDEVAIKFLWREDYAGDPSSQNQFIASFKPRFLNECVIAARLKQHPQIVTVYDLSPGDERIPPYLVMEYVNGGALDGLLKDQALTVAEKMALLEDVCLGLEQAHEEGIIHRDLKPGNVLVMRRKEGLRAKLTDFGLAKIIRPREGDTLLDLSTFLPALGTPFYAAPELSAGKIPTEKADVYSLGIMFYEALAGQRPFNGSNKLELERQHHEDSPPSLGVIGDVPPEVCELIMRALAKEPDARPKDAAEFRAELAKARDLERLRAEAERKAQDAAERERLLAEIETRKQETVAERGQREIAERRAAELEELAKSTAAQGIIRIETGMHTATINRIAVDAANRWLVTASEDKTARVWDVQSGALLRVLRPPLGAGNEGKLFAVALSPDGNTVALGGWTSPNGLDTDIYLFERASGRMIRQLSGLPNVVNHLAFSPDEQFLVVTLFGKGNGVRVYATGDGRQIGADADYGADSYGADFAPDSRRLVTSCFDGYLRLYAVGGAGESGGGLRLLAKQAAGGTQPFAVKFAPDGGKVAVGFNDTTAVNVLAADDLRLLFAPDTRGVNNGDLSKVAWSGDGDTLFAGGTYPTSGDSRIRAWSGGGRGNYAETTAAGDTILDLHGLRTGGVAFGAADPAWGIVETGSMGRTRFVTAAIANYRALLANFLVAADGMEVAFEYEYGGKAPARFAVGERRLATGEATANRAGLRAPRTSGLAVTDWENTVEPKLNGGKLALENYETSHSLAIAPDNARFLLGTEFWLRMFDRTGQEVWRNAIPGIAWAVNITADGRLAVAAFGDGTIRWYRAADGQELLAFFPHADRKRWVLWTPEGYYDRSGADAEDLIGWHVNRGVDRAADFFPAGLFRDTFHRPDIISNALTKED